MRLVKNGRVVADSYVRVPDDAPIPPAVPVLLSAERFLAEAQTLAARAAPTGVLWPNDRAVAEIAPWLDRLALIALAFPSFRDGRAYSQARLLRTRLLFRGELRATGDVLRDQFLFLARSGFDAFEVRKPADADAFAAALARYSVFYQPSADGRACAQRQCQAAEPPAASGLAPAADARAPSVLAGEVLAG